jgi:peptidase M23-like protein
MRGRPATTSSYRPRPRRGRERREVGRRRALLVLGCSLLAVLLLGPAAAGREAGRPGPDARLAVAPVQTTALAVTATGPPRHFRGTDGREHIDYDLLITNAFTADVTLRSLEVLNGRGKRLLRLEGEALAAVTFELLPPGPPTLTVPKSGVVATMVDVAVSPRAVPRRLTHRITYDLPPDAPALALVESRRVNGPKLRVARRGAIVIPPPLRGPGWVAFNACCDSPSSHRDLLFPANGRFVMQEMFDIDWIQMRNGRLYEGNGSQTSQWHGEGAPLLAVGDGTVVRAVDGKPEWAPAPFGEAILRTADDFAGNYVVVRIRRGVYAVYGHVRPGTVRVRVGQRVRTGQQLGELGNSGNTTAPHLHFGIHDGPDPLTANSLPYEFDRFRFAGVAEQQDLPSGQLAPEVSVTGTPRRMRRTYPLSSAVVDFRQAPHG